MKKIVIIGNGIAGITAARHIRKKSNFDITVVSGESDFFYSRTALMYIYMGHMKYEHTKPYEDWFWKKNKIDLVRDWVEEVDGTQQMLQLRSGKSLPYDTLIIATGSKPNSFQIPGIDAQGVQSLVSLQDLALMESNTKNIREAVIVGGGLIGVEMAEMLLSRHIKVTMLIREPEFWSNVLPIAEAQMVSRHLVEHGVNLLKDTLLKEVSADTDNRISGVITSRGEKLPCQFAGITIGVSPCVDFLKNSDIELDRGVIVNSFFETNLENVYSIGDCAQFAKAPEGRKAIEQTWYTGRMHGETLAHTICGNKTAYTPGVWFNSAKFMDLEYQVYGEVNPLHPDSETSVLWEHANQNKLLRIVYHREEKHVLGFNLLGMRFRHEVCADWIKSKTKIGEVLRNLGKADFNPEFTHNYKNDIIAVYNQQNPDDQVTLARKKILGIF